MTTSNTNKILVFFVLTFLLNLLIEEVLDFYLLYEHLSFGQLSPGIVAIFMIFYYEESGFAKIFFNRRIIPSTKPSIVQILVTFSPIVIIPLSFFIYKNFYNHEALTSKVEISYLLWAFVGIAMEELGWRGYFLYKAGSFIHMLLATLLTGLMWFLVQYDLYIRDPFYGAVSLVLYLSISIILAYLFFTSNRNLILCYVFRLTYTVLGFIFLTLSINDINFLFIITPFFIVLAALILVFNKKLFQIDPTDKL